MTPTELSVAKNKRKVGKKPPAAWIFLQRWAANPVTMGSVCPSGPGLQKLVRENLTCGPDEVVVEFGGGTGALTKAILDGGIPGDRIYTVEIDPKLAGYLRSIYPHVNVLHGDCRHIDRMLPPALIGKVGTLLVGLPMVILPKRTQAEIVDAIFRVIPEDGRFLLFTYSLTSPLDMKALGLKGTRLGWTPVNFPPAYLWGYSRA